MEVICHRFGLPVLLSTAKLSDLRAAATQGQLFVLYELANFKQKAENVNQKLWSIDKLHEHHSLPVPFAENDLLRKLPSGSEYDLQLCSFAAFQNGHAVENIR